MNPEEVRGVVAMQRARIDILEKQLAASSPALSSPLPSAQSSPVSDLRPSEPTVSEQPQSVYDPPGKDTPISLDQLRAAVGRCAVPWVCAERCSPESLSREELQAATRVAQGSHSPADRRTLAHR